MNPRIFWLTELLQRVEARLRIAEASSASPSFALLHLRSAQARIRATLRRCMAATADRNPGEIARSHPHRLLGA